MKIIYFSTRNYKKYITFISDMAKLLSAGPAGCIQPLIVLPTHILIIFLWPIVGSFAIYKIIAQTKYAYSIF